METLRSALLLLILIGLGAGRASAVGEIEIESVHVEMKSPHRYLFTAAVANKTPETRETVLRAQISFYDQTAPKGDLPVMILRKDLNLVLRGGEHRGVQEVFLNEGEAPRGSLRLEPLLRVRRQRVWNY